MIYYLTREEKL